MLLKVKAGVRAGGLHANHSRTLKVRAGVRAGGLHANHSRPML